MGRNGDRDIGVALTKSMCPCCTKIRDDTIILNTRLGRAHADKVMELHGKVVEQRWCQECQSIVDQGGVWLVEVDPDKSKPDADGNLKNEHAHRTGRVWAIKREAAERIFNRPPMPLMFIDKQAAEHIGLPDANEGGADEQDATP